VDLQAVHWMPLTQPAPWHSLHSPDTRQNGQSGMTLTVARATSGLNLGSADTPQTSCGKKCDAAMQHAPHNVMTDPGEIARFHDRCSDLMRELLGELAAVPDRPRPFPEIEDAIGWPHRRIASVLGGVSHLRNTEFEGRRPYRFLDSHWSPSGRWELWMDTEQAAAVLAESPR
jgi:hypothetical protein